MKLLLVLGAGASRNLGPTDDSMPLMSDWSTALSEALDQHEEGLAAACHLNPNMQGPEFEENLGLLLRWEQVRELEERFQLLGGPQAHNVPNGVREARKRQTKRLEAIKDILHSTLYDQFGLEQVDDQRAKAAYEKLLDRLGDPELIVATTNYDRVVERALWLMNRKPNAGFEEQPPGSPKLNPTGMIERRADQTPVIHLHGAVGWYEDENGVVTDYFADKSFNSTLGAPVVLYPDPDKDPINEALVSGLWAEFRDALAWAERILVLGHSLNDPALVKALGPITTKTPTVVGWHTSGDKETCEAKLPFAHPVKLDFGPKEIKADRSLNALMEKDFTPAGR